MEDFFVLDGYGEGEIIEKKSRFIARAYPIDSEEKAGAILEKIRKEYWDARHNCYAYVIGEHDESQRCSDDGEPSGTAGKPILEIIHGRNLHNCLIIVTRYFGGILLGTGGLVRAYQAAAIEAVENAGVKRQINGSRIHIETDYTALARLQHLAGTMNLELKNIEYTDIITAEVELPADMADELIAKITEVTAGKAGISVEEGIEIYLYE